MRTEQELKRISENLEFYQQLTSQIKDLAFNPMNDTVSMAENLKETLENFIQDEFKPDNEPDEEKDKPLKFLSKSESYLVAGKFPNFHESGSVQGMKEQYYGKGALLVKCGSYIYNVSAEPEIYFKEAVNNSEY